MRIGVNPEKKKFGEIIYKKHRVIIPVYIPNSNEKYFDNLLSVFKTSINSLIQTIQHNDTNITIINNDCKKQVTDFIDDLIDENKIDKHVKLSSNYGKIYTILSEVKTNGIVIFYNLLSGEENKISKYHKIILKLILIQ